MSIKAMILMMPLALGGLWASGALGGSTYSRDVDRSPAQVMAALSDLDVRGQPGAPGTDAAASGGVSPAFRSEGITLGLFTMAIEGELNELTGPPRRSLAECQQLEQDLLMANSGGLTGRPENLKEGLGNGARTVIRLHAVEGELRRQGCDTSGRGGGDFADVESRMVGEGPPPEAGGVNFEPGQPMVDVSRRGR